MTADDVAPAIDSLGRRLRAIAPHLDARVDLSLAVGPLLAALAECVRLDPDPSRVWLLATAVAGGYPTQDEVTDVRRGLATASPAGALGAVLAGVARTASASRDEHLDILLLENATVVDVEFCATHVHNTGIQRVVRNTMPHWVDGATFVAWSRDLTGYRELTPMQRALVIDYRSGLPEPTDAPAEVLVVPWNSVIVIPEVPAANLLPRQAALARFSGNRVVLVGHDAIPIANADTVIDAESDRFAHYLELVKYSSLVACNSRSTAGEIAGFVAALPAQGIPGPRVSAVPLPVDLATRDEVIPATDRTEPLVLTVGSVEPRKNQQGVLSAAQLLWAEGLDFELLVIGGGHSWYLQQFDREVRRLQRAGRKVRVGRGVSDVVLAQAYADARVVVFPSLQEGYGLPVAEALATGTPVVTTNYGSTAEIAVGGGCLLVDPRSDDEIAAALREVLTDDAVHARLVAEAQARTDRTWADYAHELWAQAGAHEPVS